MKQLFALLERLTVTAARLFIHSDKVDPPPLNPPPTCVWVTFSRAAGGSSPIATYCIELDEAGEGTFAALGSIDSLLALRVRR